MKKEGRIAVCLLVGWALLSACSTGTDDGTAGARPQSCETLCTADAACMRALAEDGIAPEGSTSGDRGLCNGICSTLRTMRKEHARNAKELGAAAGEWSHACLPTPLAP